MVDAIETGLNSESKAIALRDYCLGIPELYFPGGPPETRHLPAMT